MPVLFFIGHLFSARSNVILFSNASSFRILIIFYRKYDLVTKLAKVSYGGQKEREGGVLNLNRSSAKKARRDEERKSGYD